MVWDEADIVAERVKGQLSTLGIVIQAATGTTGMTAGKEATGFFNKIIKLLTGE